MSEIPPLFARVPENLLVPLASPLKQFYWETLVVAFRLHQGAEHADISKETLLDQVEEHLRDREPERDELPEAWLLEAEAGEEEPADLTDLRLFAWRLLRQLERCGWFAYEFQRDQGPVLRFPDYASRLLTTLEETARGERPRVRGLAYNVKQILTDAQAQQQDPGFVLYQARGAVAALLRELKVLRANIGRYVEQVAEREHVRDLLAFQMNDFWPKVVEPSYHQFKTSDNVLRWRLEILDRLDELADDPLFVQEAAAAVEIEEQIDAEQAKAQVYDWLDEMRAEIRSLEELIEDIDSRHAHYVGLTLQRIRYRLHRNETTETRLVEMIGQLHALPPAAEDVWEDLLEGYRLQVIGEDSLYRMPSAAESHTPEPVVGDQLSADEREAMLSRVHESLSTPLSRERIFGEVQHLLNEHDRVELADLPMGDDWEFLRLIALHSYRHEDSAPYELEISEDGPLVTAGAYRFRNGRLIRRRK